MTYLKQKQLEELKHRLAEEKEELESHFRLEDAEERGTMTDSNGELSAYDNHPADLGTEAFERGRDMAVDESMENKLREVNEALVRMEEGTYGQCRECGETIEYERLQALPTAQTCIQDASSPGINEERPVEEQVMTPPPKGAGANRQNHAGRFDNADAWKEVESFGSSDGTVDPDSDIQPEEGLKPQ
ncbi:TraR/DksA C4-type zinc finger protein [Paenibacillus sepulcri]|uniref:TraR/DksA C4-type zinc finger protein n=1 Tax=Paenibacillus sepulcri TaxID=359917 RepID=A0ABS7CE44_9BACL|nr:TraR/DksA C4-type zinc finger protein [Paenibacillus sepulcri]